MRKRILLVTLLLTLALSGCKNADSKKADKEIKTEAKAEVKKEKADDKETSEKQDVSESDAILDKAIAGDIPVNTIGEEGETYTFFIPDLPHDEEDALSYYEVGDRVDLDNDGEKELIINGPYGGMYIDARHGNAYCLASGEGTAMTLCYGKYNGITYICHIDTMHGGRMIYNLDEYNGEGVIVDSKVLSAEFWDSDVFDENADCQFDGQKITTQRFEVLVNEIFAD